MNVRARKAIGGFGLVVYVLVYLGVAATLAAFLPANPLVQLGFFAAAGVAWALPLKPLLTWMMRPDAPDAP